LTIKLYIDENVSFGKEKTGGVRIAMQLPQPKKEAIKEYIDDARFEKALKSIEDGEFSKEKLLAKFVLTADQLSKISGV
jgi:DNA topoisomerase IA